MQMRHRFIGASSVIIAALHISGCVKKKELSTEKSVASGTGSLTACVGLQGNGTNFPTHLGAYIGMLAHNVEPQVTAGGSSGSLIGSAVMALLDNNSLKTGRVTQNGIELSKAQKASLILASAQDAYESFFFLPALQRAKDVIESAVSFIYAATIADANLGAIDATIVQLESIVAQTVMLVDFFHSTDFTRALNTPNFAERRRMMKQLWMEHTGAMEVSAGEILKALSVSATAPNADARLAEINRRYFETFRSDPDAVMQLDPTEAFKDYNEALESWQRSGIGSKVEAIYNFARDRHFPGTRTISSFLDRKILIHDPKIRWQAYMSRNKKNELVPVPKGMVIHATYRSATRKGDRYVEDSGWDSLYQSYFPSPDLVNGMVARKAEWIRGEDQGYLPYSDNGKTLNVKEPSHILIFPNRLEGPDIRALSFGIKASAGEPGPFRRELLKIDQNDRQGNPGLPDLMFSFGGWAENIPLTPILHIPACKNADYLVNSGLPYGMNSFGKQALRAALEGRQAFMRPITSGEQRQVNDEQLKKYYETLDKQITYSRELKGKRGSFANDLDWDHTSSVADEKVRAKMHKAILGSRSTLIVRSYQQIERSMAKAGVPPTRVQPFAQVSSKPVDQFTDKDALEDYVNELYPK